MATGLSCSFRSDSARLSQSRGQPLLIMQNNRGCGLCSAGARTTEQRDSSFIQCAQTHTHIPTNSFLDPGMEGKASRNRHLWQDRGREFLVSDCRALEVFLHTQEKRVLLPHPGIICQSFTCRLSLVTILTWNASPLITSFISPSP